jgi:hypothetical protein
MLKTLDGADFATGRACFLTQANLIKADLEAFEWPIL